MGTFTHNSWGYVMRACRGVFVESSACLLSHDVILEDFGRDVDFGPGVIRGTGFFHL